MFFLRKPSVDRIDSLLEKWREVPANYSHVGASDGEIPEGFTINRGSVSLGNGEEVFESAKEALRAWRQFDLSWAQICWPATPLEEGKVIAVLARAVGLWSLTFCRIVYLIDEKDRFGFGYGSLERHPLQGEERFQIRRDDAGEVTFEILAFSRPANWLMKLGTLYVRRLQRQFARESPQAFLRAIVEHPQN